MPVERLCFPLSKPLFDMKVVCEKFALLNLSLRRIEKLRHRPLVTYLYDVVKASKLNLECLEQVSQPTNILHPHLNMRDLAICTALLSFRKDYLQHRRKQ